MYEIAKSLITDSSWPFAFIVFCVCAVPVFLVLICRSTSYDAGYKSGRGELRDRELLQINSNLADLRRRLE